MFFFYHQDIGNELETRVFQTTVPTIPPRSLIAVGELEAFREILMDPLTEKPMTVYRNFRSLWGGR